MNKEIEAAAEWWTQRLREMPSHKTGNPTLDHRLWMTAMMNVKPLSKEQVQTFKAALVAELNQICITGCVICNDYHADAILKRVAETAQIDHPDMRFPVKTKMTIADGAVAVKQGDTGTTELIYLLQEA